MITLVDVQWIILVIASAAVICTGKLSRYIEQGCYGFAFLLLCSGAAAAGGLARASENLADFGYMVAISVIGAVIVERGIRFVKSRLADVWFTEAPHSGGNEKSQRVNVFRR